MRIQIDAISGVGSIAVAQPEYLRIAADLRRRIAPGGEFEPGDRIPTLPELCVHYSVSEITVRNAIRLLANEGLLESRARAGTIVRKRPAIHRVPADRYRQTPGTRSEGTPKTDGSAGTIALDSLNVAVLREHRERHLAEREAWNKRAAEERAKGKGTADWTDTGKMFVDEDGTWLHPEKVSDAFRRIVARADLPPINLRDLRHCAATLIHAGGGDLHAIKETLRHDDIRLTSNTYTSLLKEVDLEIAEKAAAIVPRARKAP